MKHSNLVRGHIMLKEMGRSDRQRNHRKPRQERAPPASRVSGSRLDLAPQRRGTQPRLPEPQPLWGSASAAIKKRRLTTTVCREQDRAWPLGSRVPLERPLGRDRRRMDLDGAAEGESSCASSSAPMASPWCRVPRRHTTPAGRERRSSVVSSCLALVQAKRAGMSAREANVPSTIRDGGARHPTPSLPAPLCSHFSVAAQKVRGLLLAAWL